MKTLSLAKMVIISVHKTENEYMVNTTKGTYFLENGVATKVVKAELKKWIMDDVSIARVIEFYKMSSVSR